MKKVSGILDVAKRAGVSSATVSRVLSGRGVVTQETRSKVMAAISELGFQPNHMAQGLRRGRSNTVALLVGDIEQGVYASLTKHVQPALEAIGLDLLLYNLGHSASRLANILARADAMRLHGIIVATSDQLNEEAIETLSTRVRDNALPVIAVGLSLQRHGIPSIIYDDRRATRTSTEFLLQTYPGPAAYLGRIRGSASGSERYRGYCDAHAERGIVLDERLVWDSAYRYKAGFESVERALRDGIVFRSLQTGSDELALGAMAAVRAHGLRIPADIAVVGIGDMESAGYLSPPLTTHGGFPDVVAQTIADLLEDFRLHRPVEMVTMLERPFVKRVSA
ncbi:LacI family DNA-binding transcriptional regulator [Oceanibacterium hippocampi]|uniref:HTH-type transcriptional regulator AscG n=1 Tax=Oceanibacterium hippocampi TaxID=745714 RepID=A0A1Y5SQU6_9PROT|nr:LacI family DNA-binding transcriptional regulator [Oceanibacterium hippocampi]SLN46086.1 HTH-type transcriptional regulator AscG [Oceanibacterium hippocampi]